MGARAMNTTAWRLPLATTPRASRGRGEGSESGGQWGSLQEMNRKKFMLTDYKKQWVRTRVLKGIEIAPSVEEGDRGRGRAGGGRGCARSAPRPAPAPGHCPSDLVSGGGWAGRGAARDPGVSELEGREGQGLPRWLEEPWSYVCRGAWNSGSGSHLTPSAHHCTLQGRGAPFSLHFWWRGS